MPDQTDALFLLFFVAAAQGLFLMLIIWRNRSNADRSHLFLVGLLAVLSWIIVDFALTWSRYIVAWPHLLGIGAALHLLIGPLLWGYIRSRIGPMQWRWVYLIHLLPLLIYIPLKWDYLGLPGAVKLSKYESQIVTETYFSTWTYLREVLLKNLVLTAYVAWGWWVIRRSSTESNLPTAQTLLKWISLFTALFYIHVGLLAFDLPFYALVYTLMIAAMGVLIFLLHWKLLKRTEIMEVPVAEAPTIKYQKSALATPQLESEAERLVRLMEKDKIYLNPKLRLAELADQLGITTHQLSQVLNQQIGQKFSEFVNRYRVSHAKTLLLNSKKHKTILQIAYESGFNAKNSFNKSFKEFTGLTPGKFRSLNGLKDSKNTDSIPSDGGV